MINWKSSALVTGAVACAFVLGCSAEAIPVDADVSVESDGLQEEVNGVSWLGWTQSISGEHELIGGSPPNYHVDWRHTLSRTSGSATRGGGACVVKQTATSCTNDYAGDNKCTCGSSNCIAQGGTPGSGSAQALYGTDAYGYCFNSKCYHRPGSQPDWCVLDPERTPGTLFKYNQLTTASAPYLLGCMTKTVGPNYACGGTDPNLYMRHVVPSTLFVE